MQELGKQPSLSRQIQLLETELGVSLMTRSNRSVVLTDAGEMFLKELLLRIVQKKVECYNVSIIFPSKK